jgi:hypothetical protein
MDGPSFREILKRVGAALVLIGLLDLGWMVYCIIHGMSYSSSLNLFAVAAGILLMRGSLRTAAYVRWFSVFFISGFGTALLAWPAIQPVDLTLTEIRHNKGSVIVSLCVALLVVALLYWVSAKLGNEQIQEASEAAGVKRRDVRWAVAAGISLVICSTIAMNFIVRGETAQRMISMAEKEVGPAYHLHVTSLNISEHGSSKSVRGIVTAWNDREIRRVPIQWHEGD